MVFTITKDTFIESLTTNIQHLSQPVNRDYLYTRTGHGARFTLAMNVKTGKEIGHPSSEYIWDLPSVVDQCFPDAGIIAKVYVTEALGTLARKTQAHESRKLPSLVKILEIEEMNAIEGNLMLPLPSGAWVSTTNTDSFDLANNDYPFGPVVIDILNFKEIDTFPKATLSYLARTIERGEEPMEVEGQGHYSAVSGWKAYARWMQSFTVPLPNIQHPYLSTIPQLLLARRSSFSNYWKEHLDIYEDIEAEIAKKLMQGYEHIAIVIKSTMDGELTLGKVREIYFAEQKTQPVYKQIDNYLAS